MAGNVESMTARFTNEEAIKRNGIRIVTMFMIGIKSSSCESAARFFFIATVGSSQ
jgi:hypothetical protein